MDRKQSDENEKTGEPRLKLKLRLCNSTCYKANYKRFGGKFKDLKEACLEKGEGIMVV